MRKKRSWDLKLSGGIRHKKSLKYKTKRFFISIIFHLPEEDFLAQKNCSKSQEQNTMRFSSTFTIYLPNDYFLFT
jgi:hypothetical protein